MKLRTFLFTLITASFLATLFADPLPKAEIVGRNAYGAETLDSLQATGLIKLQGTSIANSIRLTGSLISQNAKIGTLDIIGEANLTDTTIQHGGTVLGSLQAVRSTFLQPLTILSQKVLFTASRVESLIIRQDASFKGKQIVELKQGTIISGSIHFESGKGEVIIFPGCQVLGTVTGGKIVKKS